jgi:DegV family protein with EDD domain
MEREPIFNKALRYGYERLSAWSELIDRINVFPVADSDTGTNLKISLAPLVRPADTLSGQIENLMSAATGNSGNIAAAFFREFIKVRQPGDLPGLIMAAREKAFQSVADPQPGTMLTVFDALAHAISNGGWQHDAPNCPAIVMHLQKAVTATTDMLPVLKQAGVIDAGALGMFIFLEAYFSFLSADSREIRSVVEIFPGRLCLSEDWTAGAPDGGHCINTLIRSDTGPEEVRRAIAGCGHSVVLSSEGDRVKVHMHTDDRDRLHRRLQSVGQVAQWSEEPMAIRNESGDTSGAVHIISDAAGSITRADARALGITLLDSYLIVGDQVCPETMYEPEKLYTAMAAGIKVSTAQASLFERRQSYTSATQLHDKVLYLCVGSAYTGNYRTALAWQAEADHMDRLTVIDTGAASGRLGIAVLATARFARTGATPEEVHAVARNAVAHSREFVFLDQLKYLAAGGRISKTKGFFGDLLNFKPVISPMPGGAEKVAVVRNRREQLAFALDRLAESVPSRAEFLILVQYSDNRPWVEEAAVSKMTSRFPNAEILLRPLSMTSGAHMGPGTWAVAFLPSLTDRENVP